MYEMLTYFCGNLLYPDAQKRLDAVIKLSHPFDINHYPRTASAIREIGQLLLKDSLPENFMEMYGSILELFEEEFGSRTTLGSQFRELCFDEIAKLILLSIEVNGVSRFSSEITEIEPILLKLNQSKKLVSELAEGIGSGTQLNNKLIFHLKCYAYVVIVEGTFDG